MIDCIIDTTVHIYNLFKYRYIYLNYIGLYIIIGGKRKYLSNICQIQGNLKVLAALFFQDKNQLCCKHVKLFFRDVFHLDDFNIHTHFNIPVLVFVIE